MSGNPNAEIHATGLGWFLDKFVSPFVDGIADRAQRERWKRFDWPAAEQKYREQIKQDYGRLRILGRGEVPLGEVFTDVNVLDEHTALHDYGEAQLLDLERARPFFRQPGERVRGRTKVNGGGNLYILGKPGAGKTTFLKYVATQAADYRLTSGRLPIFVSLHEWSRSPHGQGKNASLLPFLIHEFRLCHFPDAEPFVKYLLEQGKAIVLFDGLDEVQQADERRSDLNRLIQNFAREYDQTQCLLTCRIAAERYHFSGFEYVEMADFTIDQIKAYARRWFDPDRRSAQHRGATYEMFESELENTSNQSILELCSNPLLLSMLCFDFSRKLYFPGDRAELYEDALGALLGGWYADKGVQTHRDEGVHPDAQFYDRLSPKRKKEIFAAIAYESFEAGHLVFRQRWLEERLAARLTRLPQAPDEADIDATAVLKRIESQTGILVERATRLYSFAHLTFHEYFTAYWIEQDKKEGLAVKMAHDHLLDAKWREVFLLTASLLEDGDELIAAMQEQSDIQVRGVASLIELLTWASNKAACLPDQERHEAILKYIFIACTFADVFDNTNRMNGTVLISFSSLERILDFEHSFPRSVNSKFDFSSLINLILTAGPPSLNEKLLTTAFDFALLCSLRIAKLHTTTNSRWIKKGSMSYPKLFGRVVEMSRQIEQPRLTTALARLNVPTTDASTVTWQDFADTLLHLMRRKRDLVHDWQFSDEQIDRLNNWFRANELLVRCLDEASVTNKQAVRSRLLQPPSSQSK